MMKLATLKRVFEQWAQRMDITLNLDSDNPTDEQVRAHNKFPFGGARWLHPEDERLIKEDFIAMRKLIRDAEACDSEFFHAPFSKHDPDARRFP